VYVWRGGVVGGMSGDMAELRLFNEKCQVGGPMGRRERLGDKKGETV